MAPGTLAGPVLLLHLLSLLLALQTSGLLLVGEGDTDFFVYVNGDFVFRDTSISVLPMNGVKRVIASTATAKVLTTTRDLNAGDLIAIQVYNSFLNVRSSTNLLNQTIDYPSPAGVILAADDGTMSSAGFKCSIEADQAGALGSTGRIPFFSPQFNDSHWGYAEEQNPSCCPWRNVDVAWDRLNAKWIGIPKSAWYGNISGPRQFFCRHRVTGNSTSDRMPIEETERATLGAPALNITEVKVATSMSQVKFTLGAKAHVYCGMVDSRYQLRIPTHKELKHWGESFRNAPGPSFKMLFLTGAKGEPEEFTQEQFDHPALLRFTVDGRKACEDRCLRNSDCAAMVYHSFGKDLTTNTNCKLLDTTFNASKRKPPSDYETFQQMIKTWVPVESTITISGELLPGTIYFTYCSAEDVITGNHSNISVIEGAVDVKRTQGCFDCGNTNPPNITVLGGFATQQSIGLVASTSRPGRIFCAAVQIPFMNVTVTMDSATIRAQNIFNILTDAGSSGGVTIPGLTPGRLYQVQCTAEADGGRESDQADIDRSRRKIYTESTEVSTVTINSMKLSVAPMPRDPSKDEMTILLQVSAAGYIWCAVMPSANTRSNGVPSGMALRNIGQRQKVTDILQDAISLVNDLTRNFLYDVFCTAEENDFKNETAGDSVLSPFPIATIHAVEVGYDNIAVTVNVNKGPAVAYCQVYPWALRPTTGRPAPPTVDIMVAGKDKADLDLAQGGYVSVEIKGKLSGMNYDLYCYADEKVPAPPPGIAAPPRVGQVAQREFHIRETRTELQMKGPLFDELGWECTSGHNCSIDNVLGVGLSADDQLMLRQDSCPGRCRCNHIQDVYRKGGECAAISQDPVVISGVGITDKTDPLGPWCYVDPGTCPDERRSAILPDLVLSYKVCTYNATVGGSGTFPKGYPYGFPNGGVFTTVRQAGGRAFTFGPQPIVAPGYSYSMCWCNGTESPCKQESDFRIRLGALSFAGPTAAQENTNMTCRVGLPCVARYFNGIGLKRGSRIVALEDTAEGCYLRKQNPSDLPGIRGFPNWGVSESFNNVTREYFWYENGSSAPLVVPGKVYILCWCGPPRQGMVKAPGKEYRKPDGTTPEPCPAVRADGGGKFMAPAGRLVVIGPVLSDTVQCKLGVECVVPDVQGIGLQGSDRLNVLETCGKPADPPPGWSDGFAMLNNRSASGPRWTSAGWMTHGPKLSDEMLISFGVPSLPDGSSVAKVPRGVYGFPNLGMTVPHPVPGYFSWGGPTWAYAGTYVLCWCGADATTQGCNSPADFLAPVAYMVVNGPGVLPLAGQVHRCVRGRRCEVLNFNGTQPAASKLAIASGGCGTPTPHGAPNNGQSFASADGSTFRWGDDPIMVDPGLYKLCWCPSISGCNRYDNYQSYAGVLEVKAPVKSPMNFFCPVQTNCNITGLTGVGLNDMDTIMVLTVCGQGSPADSGFTNGGKSLLTYDQGTKFVIPAASREGVYQVCWCAAEQTCINPWDYTTSLGRLDVGGPDAGFTYRCFEWEVCTITDLQGKSLSEGDRFIAVKPGTVCRDYPYGGPPPPFQPGFPNDGVALPSTNGGKEHTWGSDLLRAPPGRYSLCWCNNRTAPEGCTEKGPFDIPGGFVRVGDSKEFQYITRPEDNPPRQSDFELSYLLAAPLPLLFCSAICFGVKKLVTRRGIPDPEAPPLFEPQANARANREQQMRDSVNKDVQEVLQTRVRVAALVKSKTEKQNYGLLALYGLLRRNTTTVEKVVKTEDSKVRDKKGEPKRKKPKTFESSDEEAEDDKDDEAETDDGRQISDGSGSELANSDIEEEKLDDFEQIDHVEKLPEPPSTKFKSMRNSRILKILDLPEDDDACSKGSPSSGSSQTPRSYYS
eukprot:TRINITY_DN22338_c0_g1_i1.p1 TRINITY_DN22338_c0_g1~~TRINITY_DN22338_c0_g1_i1.p1  ORF type:complete len:1864 (-),score=197.90 TRINITY_DN22338_c0_g1_i1:150-5741(-)